MREKVNILLVDDQPAKLLSYEVALAELDENLIKASSAQEAFKHLLKTEIAVVLIDVYMPDLDGFQLARMIREHPRFQKTAIIFISAVLLTDLDFLQGYAVGAVDYVPVPVVPEVLRAKIRVFTDLYRKTRELERLNGELERRVAERTAELEASNAELRRSEERLRLAFEAPQMGTWDYDPAADVFTWSPGLERVMGYSSNESEASLAGLAARIHADDRARFQDFISGPRDEAGREICEVRFLRPDGTERWALLAGRQLTDVPGRGPLFTGIDLDISVRKQAEERQTVLVHELDHRAKNLLAVIQSILRLSRASNIEEFVAVVEGRVKALARTHSLLSEARWRGVDIRRLVAEEMLPFAPRHAERVRARGPSLSLHPAAAQGLSLGLHEMFTNAVKYGALSNDTGTVELLWDVADGDLVVSWRERGGPSVVRPLRSGFGTKVIVSTIERQLRGRIRLEWLADGVAADWRIPLDSVVDRSVDPPQFSGSLGASLGARTFGHGARPPLVLVVEDDPIIGMATRATLEKNGIQAVGPASSRMEALEIIARDEIGFAILDVNLDGEEVYPVADALAERGVPFVFVTGYNAGHIAPRYAHVAVIEKPVDAARLFELMGSTGPEAQAVAGTVPRPDAVRA
jgi:PAS domain S-box-containing protein